MLPYAVTFITYGLFRFLALIAFEGDAVRDGLVKTSDFWFHWLIGATILVAVGCFMEIGEASVEWFEWLWETKEKPFQENKKRWTIPFSIVGLFFVIVGVGAEGIFEAKQASAETAIRAYDEMQTLQAQIQAGNASVSAQKAAYAAKDAQDSADGADENASDAQEKANDVAEKADDLQTRIETLNKDLEAAEPRSIILRRHAKEIQNRISKFSTQRFTGKICGLYNVSSDAPTRDDAEMAEELKTLLDILGNSWKFDDRGSDLSWPECQNEEKIEHTAGTYVRVSQEAPAEVKQAADALSTELETLLPMQSFRVYEGTLGPLNSPPDDPWTLVKDDPNLIVLIVSRQPPAGIKPFAPR